MAPDVVWAVYKGKYKIEITFEDGKRGIVDFSKYLDKGGVFNRFRDINFFKSFKVNSELGVLSWGDEVDWMLLQRRYIPRLQACPSLNG